MKAASAWIWFAISAFCVINWAAHAIAGDMSEFDSRLAAGLLATFFFIEMLKHLWEALDD